MRTVDVSSKPQTLRTAKAYGRIRLNPQTVKAILEGRVPKGSVLEASRLAGIMSVKRTSELLPFCHPLIFQHAQVDINVKEDTIEAFSYVKGIERTGYEMEALTSVAICLLTIYDMCKGMDQNMVIEEIRLIEKTGGKSQWAKDLSGKRLLVIAEGDMLQLVLNHLEKLKPSFIGMQEAEGYHMVISTQDIPIQDEFYGLQVIINQTLFSLLPTYLKRGVRIGKDPLGRVVIYIEPSEHIISAFFENFSQLLGTWADG